MSQDFGTVDRYLAKLFDCKPLSEQEVKDLCEKVRFSLFIE